MSASPAVAVRERPILFAGRLVRAILDGKKTQTRRVIQNPERFERIRECDFCCPYGVVGDRLWVRETFSHGPVFNADVDYETRLRFAANPGDSPLPAGQKWRPSIFMPRWASRLTLEITAVRVERLQEITADDVQAEGVQLPARVSEAGAVPVLALSVDPAALTFSTRHPRDWTLDDYWRHAFAVGWNSLNGKRAPWSSNPYVWCITFSVVR